MSDIFQVPATVEKITTMSSAIRIVFDTQDNLSADALNRIFQWRNKLGWLLFLIRQAEAEDVIDLPVIKTEDKRTPSMRMRAVLFRLWEQDAKGYKDFNLYYDYHMNLMIEKLKEKLT